jgi:hypothetical protein
MVNMTFPFAGAYGYAILTSRLYGAGNGVFINDLTSDRSLLLANSIQI